MPDAAAPRQVSSKIRASDRPVRIALCALLLASSTLLPRGARADTEADAEQARALFQQGVGAASEGRFDDAARAFAESEALRTAPSTRYNLASALFELGRFTEAYDALATLVWPAGTSTDTRSRADALQRRLEPRVAHLRIQLSGERSGVMVSLDGTPIEHDALGKTRTLAPGDHAVQVKRDRALVLTRLVTLAPRANTNVELLVLPRPSEPVVQPVPVSAPAPAETPPSSSVFRRWQLWTSVAAALVVGGVAGWAIHAAVDDNTAPASTSDRAARWVD